MPRLEFYFSLRQLNTQEPPEDAFTPPLLPLKPLVLCKYPGSQERHLTFLCILQVRNQLKIRLNNSCFKAQSRCWSMNDTPTMSEDLFPADNSDAYDIVRNSDFMVSSQVLKIFHTSIWSPRLNCMQLIGKILIFTQNPVHNNLAKQRNIIAVVQR